MMSNRYLSSPSKAKICSFLEISFYWTQGNPHKKLFFGNSPKYARVGGGQSPKFWVKKPVFGPKKPRLFWRKGVGSLI